MGQSNGSQEILGRIINSRFWPGLFSLFGGGGGKRVIAKLTEKNCLVHFIFYTDWTDSTRDEDKSIRQLSSDLFYPLNTD